MSFSRYSFSKLYENKRTGPSKASYRIFKAVETGDIDITIKVLEEGERLDQLAGVFYGDAKLWWVIAAASGIGWATQVPPGTRLRIPTDPSQVFGLLI